MQEVIEKGIDEKFFETTLHQIEFSNKKTREHFGLMVISHLVPYVLHGGDALSMFKINDFSNKIREDFKKGGLFENLIKKHLIDNPHELKLMMIPDE